MERDTPLGRDDNVRNGYSNISIALGDNRSSNCVCDIQSGGVESPCPDTRFRQGPDNGNTSPVPWTACRSTDTRAPTINDVHPTGRWDGIAPWRIHCRIPIAADAFGDPRGVSVAAFEHEEWAHGAEPLAVVALA